MGAARIFCRGGGKNRGAEWRAPIFELKKASFGAFWVLFFEVELDGNWLRPLSGMYSLAVKVELNVKLMNIFHP